MNGVLFARLGVASRIDDATNENSRKIIFGEQNGISRQF
jgi:hypothetical protein